MAKKNTSAETAETPIEEADASIMDFQEFGPVPADVLEGEDPLVEQALTPGVSPDTVSLRYTGTYGSYRLDWEGQVLIFPNDGVLQVSHDVASFLLSRYRNPQFVIE